MRKTIIAVAIAVAAVAGVTACEGTTNSTFAGATSKRSRKPAEIGTAPVMIFPGKRLFPGSL